MKQTMSAFQLKHIDILHFIVTTYLPNGVMAQLVARLNGIQKVRGSNPLTSTIENHDFNVV